MPRPESIDLPTSSLSVHINEGEVRPGIFCNHDDGTVSVSIWIASNNFTFCGTVEQIRKLARSLGKLADESQSGDQE